MSNPSIPLLPQRRAGYHGSGIVPALLVLCLIAMPAAGQLMPFAVGGEGGPQDIWVVLPDGTVNAVASDIRVLSIRLAGVSVRDRLRSDRATEAGQGSPAPHIALPGGGAVYRVSMSSGHTGLLYVNAKGRPRLMFRALDVQGVPAVQERVFVEPSGAWVALSTDEATGGDVVRVGLKAGGGSKLLTARTPPMPIEPESLRSSAAATWFVSAGELYRVREGGQATSVRFPKVEPWVLPELVLAESGDLVAVVVVRSKTGTGFEEDKEHRNLYVVDAQGTVIEAGKGKDDYEAPLYDHPRGPFLALSTDGSHIAYRKTEGTQELFLRCLDPLGVETQITDAPTFYNYIDNVGVLGFLDENTLFFAAGDTAVSGQPAEAMIGAGELFAGQLNGTSDPELTNITSTSGQLAPPFDTPGTVDAEELVFMPSGAQLLVMGLQLDGPDVGFHALVSVNYGSTVSGVRTQLTHLLGGPRLVPLDEHVLVISRSLDPAGTGVVRKELHVLSEIGGEVIATAVATFSDSVTLDRFVVDRAGRTAAFVATVGPGLELPLFLDLPSGTLAKIGAGPLAVSPVIAFSATSTLFLGFGTQAGTYAFGWFDGPGDGGALALPVGYGFPLAH